MAILRKKKHKEITPLLTYQLDLVKIPYITEYRFHPTRRWRIDVFMPDYKIAIECEGGQWVKGRHNSPVGFEKDMEKYNEVTIAGFKLLRFNKKMIQSGYALDCIERLILGIDSEKPSP